MVEVERFDIAQVPDHGRPKVVEFRIAKKGRVAVHVERESGALWLFVTGPQGGERGQVVIPLQRVQDALAFADASDEGRLLGNEYALSLRVPGRYIEREFVSEDTTDRFVVVNRRGSMAQAWRARFDAAALDELRTCLREWSVAVLVRTQQAPSVGEFFVRGALPDGTFEQQLAWKQAGPEGQLARISDAPVEEGRVAYVAVLRHGGSSGVMVVPLATFYGDGWRRLG